MPSTLSDQVALKVALAAKSLSSVDVKALLHILLQHFDAPLTEDKLASLSPKAFKVMLSSFDDAPSHSEIMIAFAILTNDTIEAIDAPELDAQLTLQGPKIQVAITSNQGELLNGHFGSCLRFLIYEVNAQGAQLVAIRPVDSDQKGEARTNYLVSLVRDCQILFTQSIGGPAAAKVTRANIHPVKKVAISPAQEVLDQLSKVISGTPPPWLAKALQQSLVTDACQEAVA